MGLNDLNSLVYYLIIALGLIMLMMILLWTYYAYKRKVNTKYYTKVTGRVVLKGKVDYSGVRITVGRLKSKEKLSINPILSKSGEMLRTITDKKGNFSFNDVPSGVLWFVLEAQGYKTMLKAIKLQRIDENRINDIIMNS